ncbi:MAG: dihydrolipoamide acetyltransferase family protein [Pirellulaceae bacterium]
MAHEIRLPRLGWSMEEGTFQGWLKQAGDTVQVGDPLFELEGEKALQEIESVDAGILYIPPDGPQTGDDLAVGTLLGFLLAEGESPPGVPSTDPGDLASSDDSIPGAVDPRPREDLATAKAGTSPVFGESNLAVVSKVTRSSPRARRVAQELGIDWTQLSGTGAGGRIRETDVRGAVSPAGGFELGPTSETASGNGLVSQAHGTVLPTSLERPLSSHRKVIADRLRLSQARTIPVTLFANADAGNIVAFRNNFKQPFVTSPVPAYTDIITCLVASVLRQHPALAARWNEDQSGLKFPDGDGLHIGIAVDTPEGLLVPVIHNVGESSFSNVVARSRDLVQRARTRTLTAAEMQQGVFTVTSLGGYGVTAFTPVINYPEIAILGIGAIRREAVVLQDDTIIPGDRITLSLTFDHGAIDGAPAAVFLQEVCRAVENPAPRILGK